MRNGRDLWSNRMTIMIQLYSTQTPGAASWYRTKIPSIVSQSRAAASRKYHWAMGEQATDAASMNQPL